MLLGKAQTRTGIWGCLLIIMGMMRTYYQMRTAVLKNGIDPMTPLLGNQAFMRTDNRVNASFRRLYPVWNRAYVSAH